MPKHDRLLATSWRFEQNKGNANTKKAFQESKIAVNILINPLLFIKKVFD
jgi:hypothetical protein